ncbi:MAG: hypothetical protein HY514_05225 [Candidatus Aenigmarchaeota archaeon]|nr:hypothetical protein [Candidatus Aenigmarchaeota archaeon]
MRVVYIVSADNKAKAEDLLKKDEIVNRGSITVRSAISLDIEEDGYFVVYDGSSEAVKLADQLLTGLAHRYKKADDVLRKMDAQEDAAIEGFGNILG